MYETMSEYEPREILFGVLGMLEILQTVETDQKKQDALEDVAYNIKWVLKHTMMYKKEQTIV